MDDSQMVNSNDSSLAQALHAPLSPIDPERRFAARLRARLERALTLPKGVDVTITTLDPPASASPPVKMKVAPYLAVSGAREALAWYAEVFGATPSGEQILGDDGKVQHAELDFGGSLIMLAEEHPEISHTAPRQGAGNAVSIHLQVPEVDALVVRAEAGGAIVDRRPSDNPYGRMAVLRDPFGHRWMLMSAQPAGESDEPASRIREGRRHGDIGYISFEVPDMDRAVAFYAAVLGWGSRPASDGPGLAVIDSMPNMGLLGGQPRGLPVICWRVDDLVVAIGAVRRLGGSATEPERHSYGTVSACRDDQGMRFYLWDPSEEVRATTAAASSDTAAASSDTAAASSDTESRQGDLIYMTLEVVDSARFRAFFGELLGWSFTLGHVADGWQIVGTAPMHGLHGGHSEASAVPMWQVDDIHAAVDRVRSHGGSASPVERQPYGLSATCTDDQGTRFYLLGQG